MPTVLRQRGFDIRIRTDDHNPPHVHVVKGGEEVVILLAVGFDDPEIRENRGMIRSNIRSAMDLVTANNDELLSRWRQIHP